MANTEKGQIVTGARGRVLIDHKKVGWCTGVSFQRDYNVQPVDVLDNVETEEHVVVGYGVSGRFSMVGISSRSLVKSGYLPDIGEDNEEHLKNILKMLKFTFVLEDNQTGKPMYRLEQVIVTSESVNLSARSVMMSDSSFVGIRAHDAATA